VVQIGVAFRSAAEVDRAGHRGVLLESFYPTHETHDGPEQMTQQALLDHLDGADTDVLRRVLEHAMQRLIEAEAAAHIGAAPHERATTRTTYRNGYRERVLDTGSGRLELQIPKLRSREPSRSPCADSEISTVTDGRSRTLALPAHNPRVAGSNPAPPTLF
jgi:hypothetical protein